MRIQSRRLNRWGKATKRRLRYATLSFGYLKRYMRSFPKSPTIVAFSGKHVMGWIFILHHNNEFIISFFTNKRYRRRGIATRLAQEAIKKCNKISVIKWDEATRKAFTKLKESYPSQVTVYEWPTNMPPKCRGCSYCRYH